MSRAYVALAVLVLALLCFIAGWWPGYSSGARSVQQQWDAQKVEHMAQQVATQKKARETEQSWQAAIDKEREDARKNLERVAADAAAAADQRVCTVAADYARRAAAANPAATSGGAATAFDLLADLLAGTDELAEKFAREADSSRVAGLACERSYDALAGR